MELSREQMKHCLMKEEITMNWPRAIAIAFLGALLCPLLAPKANADEWDKRTLFTFHEPVEVSGVILPAGEYVFVLLNSSADRNVVQIYNKDQTELYTTIETIPDYRMDATDNTVVTFRETSKNEPMSINEWFYPGDLMGQEFPQG